MKHVILPSDELVEEAQARADELGSLNNSIRAGAGNFVGILGEMAFAREYGFTYAPTYDYDVITSGGKKLDVKTKERTVASIDSYLATVADFNTKQECDGYVFLSIFENEDGLYVVEVMGWMPKDEFYQEAKFYREGDRDPGGNGWNFKADCYNIQYGQLRPIPAKPILQAEFECRLCGFKHQQVATLEMWIERDGADYFGGKETLRSQQTSRFVTIVANHKENKRLYTQADIYGNARVRKVKSQIAPRLEEGE